MAGSLPQNTGEFYNWMQQMENIGKLMVGLGLLLVVGGLVFWFFGDRLGWFGHLPGDIRVQRDNFSFFMPITSMIIVSVVLSLLLSLLARLLR
jgi:hypothetical protein